MDLDLNDRTILVSGGASGIGAAVTRACLHEGAKVVVAGRPSSDGLFETEMASHPRCSFFPAELGEETVCRGVIDFVRVRYGGLYGLVNNAGTNDQIGLHSGNPARFFESLRQNLLHYYALAHYAVRLLEDAGGAIVNVSSKVALTGQGGTSAYAAAKGAQLALTREWAAELAPAGVRVNAVIPAEVDTPLYHRWLSSQSDPSAALSRITARVPLGHRLTRSEEIAAAVVFLLSPTQSAHTTGQHVVVDGGYTHLDRALA